jgi:predicted ATPase
MDCSAAAVAAGLEEDVEAVEEWCATLASRGQFLQASGGEEWPDGTVAGHYRFLHALYHQVVYKRVPVGRRVPLHRRIGAREEAGYREQAGEHAAELATHFEQGREYRRALRYLRQAAENALQRYAYREAIGYLSRGLAALPRLADSRERAQLELTLQIALGQALNATQGPAAPAVGQAYTRAQELCEQVGEVPQHFAVLRGLRRFYSGRGELQAAEVLAEQFLSLAQQAQDSALLMEAHVMLGVCSFYLGEVAPARAHVERGLALYEPQHHGAHVLHSGQDLRVIGLVHVAMALWILGYPDQALGRMSTALDLAQALSHPWTLVLALGYAAGLHLLCGDWQAAQDIAGTTIRLATEQGFALWVGQGLMLQGWVLTEQGEGAEGLAQMRQGLAIVQAAGQQQGQAFWLALLAERCGKAGQADEGLHVLSEALAIAHTQGLRLWEAELHRLQGELLLAHSGAQQAEVEACFRQALDISRRQGAKAFELRATLSLSRLRQCQGRRDEIRELLAGIYGWFTEGFDTADLQEAKVLLKALS